MDVLTLLIALAGLSVAVAGYRINRSAIRQEQADRRRQIEDEWAREWAAQRPVVYPLALPEWVHASEGSDYRGGNARLLPLKNGGRGPALNIRGEIVAIGPTETAYKREVEAGTIAAGDLLNARIASPGVQHWNRAKGALRYRDLAGTEYETRFECSHDPGNELVVTTQEPTIVGQSGASGPRSAGPT